MKCFFISITCILLFLSKTQCQQHYADSLKNIFNSQKDDSTRAFALYKLGYYYSLIYPDSALSYANRLIKFSEEENYACAKALGLIIKGQALDRFADYPEALDAALLSIEIAKNLGADRPLVMGLSYNLMGHLYYIIGNSKDAINYFRTATMYLQQSDNYSEIFYSVYFQLAAAMINEHKPDSALYYLNKGKLHLEEMKVIRDPAAWLRIGNIYAHGFKNFDSAEYYFKEGIKLSKEFNTIFLDGPLYEGLAFIFHQKHNTDSALFYVSKTLDISHEYNYPLFEAQAYTLLADIYEPINVDSSLKYLKLQVNKSNEIFSLLRVQQFQKAAFNAQKRQQEIEAAQARYQNKIRTYLFIGGIVFLTILAIIFWGNNRQKQKANKVLQTTLSNLKSTQAQLIQSEKMASLGELTAGIAHEIQNPLNFVNNFSEVNNELIEELKSQKSKLTSEDQDELLNHIFQNNEKINHHGKRADAIVKGMLQHSRKSEGKKEPTDINALCDEYLRLSYYGLRAKDKNFNADFKTDFDASIGKINIVSQDIGRVLLNLFNNAFYAVNEKLAANRLPVTDNYKPTVSVQTKKINDKVEITVSDNGNGIPQNVIDKIFQPFFTTKPTGQGTGLGLSLAYDIITKEHNGTIRVESKEREGTTFIIKLPVA